MSKERMIRAGAGLLLTAANIFGIATSSEQLRETTVVLKPSVLVVDTETCGKPNDAPSDIFTIDPSKIEYTQELYTGNNGKPILGVIYDKAENKYTITCLEEIQLGSTTQALNDTNSG